MAQVSNKIEIDEKLLPTVDAVDKAQYTYKRVQGDSDARVYKVSVEGSAYEQLAATIEKPILPFKDFVRVLRHFMMADKAADKDIGGAFHLLHTDDKNTIDIKHLAVFMPIIVPNGTPSMLVDNLRKLEKKLGYKVEDKVDLTKFTKYFRDEGLGRDTVLECLQKN